MAALCLLKWSPDLQTCGDSVPARPTCPGEARR